MRVISRQKQIFLELAKQVRTGAISISDTFPFQPLLRILSEQEPQLFTSGTIREFPAIFDEDNEVVRFEQPTDDPDHLLSFSVVFSEDLFPLTELPLCDLLEIALYCCPDNESLFRILEALEREKMTQYPDTVRLKKMIPSILTVLESVVFSSPDFGLQLLYFLVPDNTYFINKNGRGTIFDVDTHKIDRESLQGVRRFPKDLQILFSNRFFVNIRFLGDTFSIFDFPVQVSAKKYTTGDFFIE